MRENPQFDGRQDFVSNISAAVLKRVENAEPVKLFSNHDDKKVELVQDSMGQRFVRRTYSPDHLSYIERTSNEKFQRALSAMRKDFVRAGLEVVPHFIANPQRGKEETPIVVSKYLEDAKPVSEATTETKADLAKGLGNLLLRGRDILPRLEMMQEDMFRVATTRDGEESAMLVDLDPLVTPRFLLYSGSPLKDLFYGKYVDRVSELFYDHWTEKDERLQVMGSLMDSLSPLFERNPGEATLMAMNKLNLMKQAVDPRNV